MFSNLSSSLEELSTWETVRACGKQGGVWGRTNRYTAGSERTVSHDHMTSHRSCDIEAKQVVKKVKECAVVHHMICLQIKIINETGEHLHMCIWYAFHAPYFHAAIHVSVRMQLLLLWPCTCTSHPLLSQNTRYTPALHAPHFHAAVNVLVRMQSLLMWPCTCIDIFQLTPLPEHTLHTCPPCSTLSCCRQWRPWGCSCCCGRKPWTRWQLCGTCGCAAWPPSACLACQTRIHRCSYRTCAHQPQVIHHRVDQSRAYTPWMTMHTAILLLRLPYTHWICTAYTLYIQIYVCFWPALDMWQHWQALFEKHTEHFV